MRLRGTWRIIEMQLWDQEAIELIGPAFIEFGKDQTGKFRFIAVEGGWTAAMASAMGVPGSSSPGTAMTRAIKPRGVAGRRWRLTARCMDASTSTLATTRASERCASRMSRKPGAKTAREPSRVMPGV